MCHVTAIHKLGVSLHDYPFHYLSPQVLCLNAVSGKLWKKTVPIKSSPTPQSGPLFPTVFGLTAVHATYCRVRPPRPRSWQAVETGGGVRRSLSWNALRQPPALLARSES